VHDDPMMKDCFWVIFAIARALDTDSFTCSYGDPALAKLAHVSTKTVQRARDLACERGHIKQDSRGCKGMVITPILRHENVDTGVQNNVDTGVHIQGGVNLNSNLDSNLDSKKSVLLQNQRRPRLSLVSLESLKKEKKVRRLRRARRRILVRPTSTGARESLRAPRANRRRPRSGKRSAPKRAPISKRGLPTTRLGSPTPRATTT